jgi:lysophospholipase L1-like esterase
MKKRIRKGLFAITVPVASVITCLLLIEAIGRVSGFLQTPSRLTRFSPTKGYELIPGHGEINTYGLRDREFQLQKPPDTYRIVAIGDSFTYGDGVRKEDTWVKQLESLLNREAGGETLFRYEVLNAGVPGYNTEQEFIHFNEVGLQLHPDLTVLQFTLNDAELGSFGLRDVQNRMWLLWTKEWLKAHFALYSFLRLSVGRLTSQLNAARLGVEDTSVLPLMRAAAGETSAEWERCRQSLASFARTCQAIHIPIVLVIYPMFQNLTDTYPYKSIHRLIAETGQHYGMVVVDLLPAFLGRNARTMWASPENPHPNASANAIAVMSIYESLLSHGLIPDPGHHS